LKDPAGQVGSSELLGSAEPFGGAKVCEAGNVKPIRPIGKILTPDLSG
jgi:hypothetical protein